MPVASGMSIDAATAAIRQSACASVTPAEAWSRRQSPARAPSRRPICAIRSPSNSRAARLALGLSQAAVDLLDIDRRRERDGSAAAKRHQSLDGSGPAAQQIDQHGRVERDAQALPESASVTDPLLANP